MLGLEVFRSGGCPLSVQAPGAGDLPCPSVPLQSVTAGASRRASRAGETRLVLSRGAKSPASSSRSAALPALGGSSRRRAPSFAAVRGQALLGNETGVPVRSDAASSRASAEARVRLEAVHAVGLPSRRHGRSPASSLCSPTRGLVPASVPGLSPWARFGSCLRMASPCAARGLSPSRRLGRCHLPGSSEPCPGRSLGSSRRTSPRRSLPPELGPKPSLDRSLCHLGAFRSLPPRPKPRRSSRTARCDRTRSIDAASFTSTRVSPPAAVLPRPLGPGRSRARLGEVPSLGLAAEAVLPRAGLSGSGVLSLCRSSGLGLPSREAPPTCWPLAWTAGARRAAGCRRQLPWGSGPFGVSGPGNRYAGLPPRRLPLSGFLTPSAVSSCLGRVALFRATSALRVSVFRAFPAPSAVTPLGALCSPAVSAGLGVARANPSASFTPVRSTSPPSRSPSSPSLAPSASPSQPLRHQPPRLLHRSGGAIGRAALTAARSMQGVPELLARFPEGSARLPSQARAYDFRALLRRSSRSPRRAVSPSFGPVLS
jgi:hypothetical protein